ncbi:MAG: hypothetical protein HGGPFJEG_01989 [Ignavibacteria bacterium]|nr:hypothetical protein [Ignavibacteria bacterium]
MKVKINKCICYDTTFKEMISIMIKNNLKSIDELRNIKPVSLNCKLCLPYINKMIETGKTEFNETLN